MILQGCRPEELMALRKEHVDIEQRRMKIAGGKTRSARRVLDLGEESLELLAARTEGESPWLFPSDRRPGRRSVNCMIWFAAKPVFPSSSTICATHSRHA